MLLCLCVAGHWLWEQRLVISCFLWPQWKNWTVFMRVVSRESELPTFSIKYYMSFKQICQFSLTKPSNSLHVFLVHLLHFRSLQSCVLLNHFVWAETTHLLCLPGGCIMPHHPCLQIYAEFVRDCKTLVQVQIYLFSTFIQKWCSTTAKSQGYIRTRISILLYL